MSRKNKKNTGGGGENHQPNETNETTAIIHLRKSLPVHKPFRPREYHLSRKRRLFIKNYERFYGNVTMACHAVGLNRATFYRWLKSDSPINRKFREKLKNIPNLEERKKDVIEGALMGLVEEMHPRVTVFAAETKLQDRGYGRKIEVKQTVDAELAELKHKIERVAEKFKTSYETELQKFLAEFSDKINPEIKEKLVSELVN